MSLALVLVSGSFAQTLPGPGPIDPPVSDPAEGPLCGEAFFLGGQCVSEADTSQRVLDVLSPPDGAIVSITQDVPSVLGLPDISLHPEYDDYRPGLWVSVYVVGASERFFLADTLLGLRIEHSTFDARLGSGAAIMTLTAEYEPTYGAGGQLIPAPGLALQGLPPVDSHLIPIIPGVQMRIPAESALNGASPTAWELTLEEPWAKTTYSSEHPDDPSHLIYSGGPSPEALRQLCLARANERAVEVYSACQDRIRTKTLTTLAGSSFIVGAFYRKTLTTSASISPVALVKRTAAAAGLVLAANATHTELFLDCQTEQAHAEASDKRACEEQYVALKWPDQIDAGGPTMGQAFESADALCDPGSTAQQDMVVIGHYSSYEANIGENGVPELIVTDVPIYEIVVHCVPEP